MIRGTKSRADLHVDSNLERNDTTSKVAFETHGPCLRQLYVDDGREEKLCALNPDTGDCDQEKAPIQTLCGESCRGGSTNSPNKRE